MFRSKTRNLIFPQSEHLRLSGALALHWGNDDFERPALPFDSFVMGAALHDWGHGFFDTNEIGAMDEPARVRSMTNLVHARLADRVAETVMLYHVKRLMGEQVVYEELRPILGQRIDDNLNELGLASLPFEQADRITNLTDMISFDFGFDRPIQRSIAVYAKLTDVEQTPVAYEIDDGGRIRLDPWPLRVDSLAGYVLAYDASGYPDVRVPLVVPYEVVARDDMPSSRPQSER